MSRCLLKLYTSDEVASVLERKHSNGFFKLGDFFFYMYCRLCFDHFYSNVYNTTALCVSKNMCGEFPFAPPICCKA